MAPADQPSDVTIATLAEIGIDDSTHLPSAVTENLVASSTVVVALKPGLALPQIDGLVTELLERVLDP